MTLIIQSEAYIIGIEKALDDSERTVGSIIEPQKDGSLRVVATFNEAVASVIEQLDNKVRAAEQRVKEMEAKQQHISLKPHVYRELVNQLRDTTVKYVGCQHLREQLSRTLQYALVADSQPATAQIQMRVTPDRKNRYVRQAQAEGLKLTDWIQKHMDNVCNDAGQPDTTPYVQDK